MQDVITLKTRSKESDRSNRRYAVRESLAKAALKLSPYWPLTHFVAANPLHGFVSRPFGSALEAARTYWGAKPMLELSEYRAKFRAGRIRRQELEAAIEEALPGEPASLIADLLAEGPSDLFLATGEETVGFSDEGGGLLVERAASSLPEGAARFVEEQSERWLSAYLGAPSARWAMPGRERGLYAAWRELAPYDFRPVHFGIRDWTVIANFLPQEAEAAIETILSKLQVPADKAEEYLTRHLVRAGGWASMMQQHDSVTGKDGLLDLVAVRLAYEYAVVSLANGSRGLASVTWPSVTVMTELSLSENSHRRATRAERIETHMRGLRFTPPSDPRALAAKLAELSTIAIGSIWQSAYEWGYRRKLLSELGRAKLANSDNQRPQAQMVFCIDVRSEGLRLRLEKQGRYQTLGFAGFFGLSIAYQARPDEAARAQCPVLLKPKYQAKAVGVAPEKIKEAVVRAVKDLKAGGASSLAAVEPIGAAAVLPFVGRSLGLLASPPKAAPKVSVEMPLDDRIASARAILEMTGLAFSPLGRLVVLCGHGSHSENNPYASSLDCGACGGHNGAPNARVGAKLLNDPEVRSALARGGLLLPEDTCFLAAEHNTTNDVVAFFDEDELPKSHLADLQELKASLERAGRELRQARLSRYTATDFEQSRATDEVLRRTADWSEVRPEWGLLNNAAFLIADRSLSKHVDLEGRVFLNSYRPEDDPSGAVLEVILTAPVIVAHWINSQYYFSTVDNEVFGSGNKALHTVVGNHSVFEGNGTKLRLGLPLQSLHDGQRFLHEPLRLLVIAHAKPEMIDGILERHESIRRLVEGEWLQLVSWDPQGQVFLQRQPKNGWKVVTL